jgi:hypothetical protein
VSLCGAAGTLASYSPATAKAVVDAGVGTEVVAALRGGGAAPAASGSKTGAAGPTTMTATTAATAMASGGRAGRSGPRESVPVPAAAAWALEQMGLHGEETTMPLIAQVRCAVCGAGPPFGRSLCAGAPCSTPAVPQGGLGSAVPAQGASTPPHHPARTSTNASPHKRASTNASPHHPHRPPPLCALPALPHLARSPQTPPQGALTAALDGYVAASSGGSAGDDAGAIFGRCKAALKALVRNCASTSPLEPLVVAGERARSSGFVWRARGRSGRRGQQKS